MFTAKLRKSTKYSHISPASCLQSTTSSSMATPHLIGTFVTVSECTLTHYHPKSEDYIRVHSLCYSLYGFQQM